ncbi:MAG: PhoH family protein, partial [Planctomycetes bacterium]|nr:PhoH family protein [Planctomycetota bacterium]
DPGQMSGLRDAMRRLRGCPGIELLRLSVTDIVRHRLVHEIVRCYDDQGTNGAPGRRASDNHIALDDVTDNGPDNAARER